MCMFLYIYIHIHMYMCAYAPENLLSNYNTVQLWVQGVQFRASRVFKGFKLARLRVVGAQKLMLVALEHVGHMGTCVTQLTVRMFLEHLSRMALKAL